MSFYIPWFPKELKANSRVDRRSATDQRQKYKGDCKICALGMKPNITGSMSLKITFYPPSKHKRDLDNCLASIKYGIDGIAMAWGVDDSIFHPITIDWGHIVPNGSIKIEVPA